MATETFIVVGKPEPWSVSAFQGQIRPKSKVRRWQREVFYAARAGLGMREFDGPVRVDVVVVIQRPKSRSKKDPGIFIPHTVKPDRDNYGKAIQDALVRPLDGLQAILRDDCTAWLGEVVKVWAPVGVGSFAVVSVEPVDDAEAELERTGLLGVARFGASKIRAK